MLTKLNPLSPMNVSKEELDTLKIIQKYGNGDFFTAYKNLSNLINEEFAAASMEGAFTDKLRTAGSYILEKIIELWKMIVRFLHELVTKNLHNASGPEYSVLQYGAFPPGYRPSEFENSTSITPEQYYMRDVRTLKKLMEVTTSVIDAISAGGSVSRFFGEWVHNTDAKPQIESIITRWEMEIKKLEPQLKPLCSFNFKDARDRCKNYFDWRYGNDFKPGLGGLSDADFAQQVPNMTREEYERAERNYLTMFGEQVFMSSYLTITPTPSINMKSDPYAPGSGWDNGAVYKSFIDPHSGSLVKLISDLDRAVSHLRSYTDDIINKYNEIRLYIINNHTLPPYANLNYYVNIKMLNIPAIMMMTIINYLVPELSAALNVIQFNARAISKDVNYKNQHR